MFTGLIDDVGTIDRVGETPAGRELHVVCRYTDLAPGESIAVNGACLTVREQGPRWFTAAAVVTTLDRTTIGTWRVGTHVNLERSLASAIASAAISSRATSTASAASARRSRARTRSSSMSRSRRHCRDTGAAWVSRGRWREPHGQRPAANDVLQLSIVEYTMRHTTLGALRAGDLVQIETDMLGKYVRRLAAPFSGAVRHAPLNESAELSSAAPSSKGSL